MQLRYKRRHETSERKRGTIQHSVSTDSGKAEEGGGVNRSECYPSLSQDTIRLLDLQNGCTQTLTLHINS